MSRKDIFGIQHGKAPDALFEGLATATRKIRSSYTAVEYDVPREQHFFVRPEETKRPGRMARRRDNVEASGAYFKIPFLEQHIRFKIGNAQPITISGDHPADKVHFY